MQSRLIKKNLFTTNHSGFTLVEVVAALALLTIMISSVLVLMNRFVDAVIDMRLRQSAFELARSNMETLLSETKLSDVYEYGDSETNPAIEWETIVEPFYEPVKNRMWIRAVCSASYIDSKGQEQDVELEHWITSLTAAQIKQILAQQQVESEYMDLIQEGTLSAAQQATLAYLGQQGLDAGAYQKLLKQHLRQKLEYLNKNGLAGYDTYLEQLQEEEDVFLEKLGMNFDDYNEFAKSYVPPAETGELPDEGGAQDMAGDTAEPAGRDERVPAESADDTTQWDWANIPRELWPLIQQLTGTQPPSQ